MLFNTTEFLLFFIVVFLVCSIFPRRFRYIWLLAASYFFYCSWNIKYAALILITTIITYLSGLLLEKASCARRLILAVSIVSNLLLLLYFKYFGFIIDTLNLFLGKSGMRTIESLDIILPVGISFYTFQALSYSIDVYKGETDVERNFFKYALYISFFPQLVAGPIERSKKLFSQINGLPEVKMFDFDRLRSGFITAAYGIFLKVMIADRLSMIADRIFAHYYRYGTVMLLTGAVCFSLQIYCDFSGYSVAAVGIARMLGIELIYNFNTPYFSTGLKDFWRRWHISLSTWFRDYIYIPLGGNRKGRPRKYLNIMITFLLSGLWHGAGWHFILWGGLNGIGQVLEEISKPIRSRVASKAGLNITAASHKALKIIITFILSTFMWIFFRAESTGIAIRYIMRIFTHPDIWTLFDGQLFTEGIGYTETHILILSIALLFIVSLLEYRKHKKIDELVVSQNAWFQLFWCWSMCAVIMLFGVYGSSEEVRTFIYFQF